MGKRFSCAQYSAFSGAEELILSVKCVIIYGFKNKNKMSRKKLFLAVGFLSAAILGRLSITGTEEVQFAEESMSGESLSREEFEIKGFRQSNFEDSFMKEEEIFERQNEYYSNVNEEFEDTLNQFDMVIDMLENSGEDSEKLEEYSKLIEKYMKQYEENSEEDAEAAVELYEEKMKPLKNFVEAEMLLYGFDVEEDSSEYFVESLGSEDESLEDFFEGKPSWMQEKLFNNLYDSGSASTLEQLSELSEEADVDFSKFIDRMAYLDPEKVKELMEEKLKQVEAMNYILSSFEGSSEEKIKLTSLVNEMSEYVFPSSMDEEVESLIADFAEDLDKKNFDETYKETSEKFEYLKSDAVNEKVDEGLIPFEDVDEEDWFANYVQEIKEEGIVSGYEDGTYGAENPVTVGEILKMVMELSGEGKSDAQSKNINARRHWAEGYFAKAEEMGLTLTSDLSVHPGRSATRAEAVRLMLEVGGFDVSGANEVEFYDVEFGSEDAKYIQFAADMGFISGDPEGTFRPNDQINRAEIAKVVSNFNDFFKSLQDAEDIEYELEDEEEDETSFIEKIMSSVLNVTSSLMHIKH